MWLCISDSILFLHSMSFCTSSYCCTQIYFVAFNTAQDAAVCIPRGFLFILIVINTSISELPDTTSSAANRLPPNSSEGLCENVSGSHAQAGCWVNGWADLISLLRQDGRTSSFSHRQFRKVFLHILPVIWFNSPQLLPRPTPCRGMKAVSSFSSAFL